MSTLTERVLVSMLSRMMYKVAAALPSVPSTQLCYFLCCVPAKSRDLFLFTHPNYICMTSMTIHPMS